METVETKRIEDKSSLPWDLLLSADPSKKMVESYIGSSDVYTTSIGEKVIGVYVLTKADDNSIELKNIAIECKDMIKLSQEL